MTGHRPLQSPVLVGRDDLLALADRRLVEAAAVDDNAAALEAYE